MCCKFVGFCYPEINNWKPLILQSFEIHLKRYLKFCGFSILIQTFKKLVPLGNGSSNLLKEQIDPFCLLD